jgi:folate-binding protein YgfZ
VSEVPRAPDDRDAHFTSDYLAARQALAHRIRALGVLAVEGPDRVDFLQGQLTQDVRGLGSGQARRAAGLTPKGKLIYFGRVRNDGDRLLLLVPSDARGAVTAHLAKYAAFQKVTVRDATEAYAALGLYGPAARGLVGALAPGDSALPPEGEFAAELFGPRERLDEWERALRDARSIGVSSATAEILRVEAGRPRLGRDANESNLPDEVGLSDAISASKGCYVGQEVVARLRTYGRVNRRLVGFRFPGEPVPEGTAFSNPEKPDHELGRVTSAVVSPRFGAIGLGLAFRDVPDDGTLSDPARPELRAIVSPLPFA